eukprot:SAG11_NODE_15567_length_573_cov_2.297468_1_plen_41_part_10
MIDFFVFIYSIRMFFVRDTATAVYEYSGYEYYRYTATSEPC